MGEYGRTSDQTEDDRMSIDEIELLEAWLDGEEALTTKQAKALLQKGISTGCLGRSFHYVQAGIEAGMAGPKAWPKLGLKVLK